MRDVPLLQALRRLVRHESLYAFATWLLLSIGVGALAAMLALHRGTLAQPPPLPNWDRLVLLLGSAAQAPRLPLSFPDYEDLRREASAFEDLALTRLATFTVETGEGAPQRVAGARVTPNLAAVLGVQLRHGAGFDARIGEPADQAILSERYWRSTFGARPPAGITLRVGGRALQVVGVLPRGVRFPAPEIDLWIPLAPTGNEVRRDYAFTTPWGLVAKGRSVDEARAQLASIVAAIEKAHPDAHTGLVVEPRTAADELLGTHRPLIVVFALVGLLVFVAVVANVAALSAARALSHRGAVATRLVLGATQRSVLADGARVAAALLALATAAGGALAWAIVRAAEAADAESFTALRAGVDAGVCAGVASGVLLMGIAMLAPIAWLLRRLDVASPGVLRTRASSADRGAVRAAGSIVALQLAMCFATIGMLVLARQGLAALERVDLGFDATGRYSVALGVPELDHAATIAGFEAAIAEATRVPGIDRVAAVSRLPLLRGASSVGVVPSSLGLPGESALPADARLVVGPAHEALGLRLLRGRFIADDDRARRPPVVVVDRRFAEQWLSTRDPVGATLRFQIDPTIEWQVVGVIDDVRWRTFDQGTAPTVLFPAAQFANVAPMRNAQLVVRGRLDLASDVEPLRDALRRGMPLLSADTPQPLEAVFATASAQARLASRLLRVLTAIALVLSLLGVGALLLYRFERQRHAIGIRLCLGSTRMRIVSAALADSLALAVAGALAGALLIAIARRVPEATRLLPGDGFVAAAVIAAFVVSALALIGTAAPAWRTSRLEPSTVLDGSR